MAKPYVCSKNSNELTEWEKTISWSEKTNSEISLVSKIEVFKLFLIVGRSAACRSRPLPAQGQWFLRHGSKGRHRVLKNCVTLDQFALCILAGERERKRERESVENGTELTNLKLLWTKERASRETNYEIYSWKEKMYRKKTWWRY